MRVIVCGSRDWTDRGAVNDALDTVWARLGSMSPERITVVHGACRGPDLFGSDWARHSDRHTAEPWPAEWDQHGKAAGPIRNQQMADAGADLCLAFWDGQSRGTLDMITRATRAGIPVEIVPPRKEKAGPAQD